MKIEILHVRDPDGGCDHTVFVDGLAIEHPALSVEDVDAGRGYTREDWDESTEWFLDQHPSASEAFKAAVLAAREDPPGGKYIEED